MENINRHERLELLSALGQYIQANDASLQEVMQQAYASNGWFTLENQESALQSIAAFYLDKQKLEQWTDRYAWSDPGKPHTVGLIMAGNLPLVGFHDWLSVFVAGHKAQIKLSDKDPLLLPYLIGVLTKMDARVGDYVTFTDRLSDFDAVIATGSNNSSRYFDYYFGKYPHIIRKNRHAVAVLTGEETAAEWLELGKDIFQYFGLGCRNVSKLYVPKGFVFDPLLEALHEGYKDVVLHHKYKNNYDYNYTLMLLNRMTFRMNGCLLLTESPGIASRIAELHYSCYNDLQEVENELRERAEEIQCICAREGILSLAVVPFGKAQQPELWDYADGVDTMAFLLALS